MTFRTPSQPGQAGSTSSRVDLPATPSGVTALVLGDHPERMARATRKDAPMGSHARGVAGLFGASLEEFIKDMHGVDVIWKPSHGGGVPF